MMARLALPLVIILLLLPGSPHAQEPHPAPLDSTLATLDSLIEAGNYREAEDRARALLSETEAEHGAESLQSTEVLDRLVESLWRGGQAADPSVLELAERAIAVKESVLGPDHADLGESLSNLSAVYWMLGEFEQARPAAERALAIRERTLGSDHPDVARSLNNMGQLLERLGDYDGARMNYERSHAIWENALGSDHPDTAIPLGNLASLLSRLGDYEAARPLYERALTIREKALGPDHPKVASSLSNLANLLYELGDGKTARPIYERALAIREKALGPDHPAVANSLGSLASVLLGLGDYEACIPLFERSLAIYESAYGPNHTAVSDVLNNLSLLHRSQGDHEAAVQLLERALAISEDTYGVNSPETTAPLTNLAATHLTLGDYEAAIPIAERTMAIWVDAHGPEHPDVAGSLDNLTVAHWGLGNYEEARSFSERALAIREKSLGPYHWKVANTLNNLLTVAAIQGDIDEALDMALEAESIGRERMRFTTRSLSEREALRYATARSGAREFVLMFAADMSDANHLCRAWDSEVRSRAVVLDEMVLRHSSALASDDPEVEMLRNQLGTARGRLAETVVRGPAADSPEDFGEECKAAQREKEAAERRLAAVSEQFRSELELEHAGLEEVQDALPDECALLAFSAYPHVGLLPDDPTVHSYIAFLMSAPGQHPIAFPLGRAATIDSLVGLWKEQVSGVATGSGGTVGSERVYRRTGDALRRAIWDPIAEHLGGIDQLFIVPDGTLNLLSFGTLPVGENEYLIERGPRIHYLSAERDILLSRRVPHVGEGILAVGDPDFNALPLLGAAASIRVSSLEGSEVETDAPDALRGHQAWRRDLGAMRFTPLPATGSEIDDISSIWGVTGEDLYLKNEEASEAAVKTRSPGKRVLHLATHGFFLGEEEGGVEGPLLLSGIALAGANRRDDISPGEEDGIVTAEEVCALDLRGVDWAVLSACETGVGSLETGEGVMGLRRAFQLAGVGTVIMSLWEVEDEATREWMRALYRGRFEDNLSTAEAVRSAGLSVLNSRREQGENTHPFFWGAFIAAGDWR